MGYNLASTDIKAPTRMREDNSTQYAENRTLNGTKGRDYFGTNKRVWTFEYDNLNVTDFATINTIYQSFLTSEAAVALIITEGNYAPATASVFVEFLTRSFSISGSSYLSDCTLILTEA